jgi:hypothetical protein
MTAREAIRRFLDAFDVPARRVPAEPAAQAALYRSLVADRRMLVVLDNARDADHVRPLLPGGPGCLTLVTSRNQLTGLVVADCAEPIGLDLLTGQESRQLLAARLGPQRVAAEPDAVDQIVTSCARLPLALAVAAAHAAARPDLPLAAFADRLRNTHARLDALATGDPATDVRAVLSWSYQALSREAARLFRLLGLHSGADISVAVAASLAGLAPRRIPALFAELIREHLVVEPVPGRYSCHDLLRAYAAETGHTHDSEPYRRTALHRLLDHYLHSARSAAVTLAPFREPVPVDPSETGVTPEQFTDHDAAFTWLTAEHRGIAGAVRQAAQAGHRAQQRRGHPAPRHGRRPAGVRPRRQRGHRAVEGADRGVVHRLGAGPTRRGARAAVAARPRRAATARRGPVSRVRRRGPQVLTRPGGPRVSSSRAELSRAPGCAQPARGLDTARPLRPRLDR